MHAQPVIWGEEVKDEPGLNDIPADPYAKGFIPKNESKPKP